MNNLLDVASINSGKVKIDKKIVDIVLLTREIADSIATYVEQKDINILFLSTQKKKNMMLDEEKYERILLNLLSNAIKFTPTGKSITISLSGLLFEGKNLVCIKVIDEGIGIPSDM